MKGHVLASSDLLVERETLLCSSVVTESCKVFIISVIVCFSMLEVQSMYSDVSFDKLPMHFSLSMSLIYMWAGKVTTLIQLYSDLHP